MGDLAVVGVLQPGCIVDRIVKLFGVFWVFEPYVCGAEFENAFLIIGGCENWVSTEVVSKDGLAAIPCCLRGNLHAES